MSDSSSFTGLILRGLALLAPLAAGVVAVVQSLGPLELPLARTKPSEAATCPLTVGLDTEYGVARIHGLPIRSYELDGDHFWVYPFHTHTDIVNLERLGRGEADLENPTTQPTLMKQVSALRFDGQSRMLKRIYLRGAP
jgi:hypothetical protein